MGVVLHTSLRISSNRISLSSLYAILNLYNFSVRMLFGEKRAFLRFYKLPISYIPFDYHCVVTSKRICCSTSFILFDCLTLHCDFPF